MENSCPERGVLHSYLDHEVTSAVRSEIAVHLTRCPACQAVFAELEATSSFVAHSMAAASVPAPSSTIAWQRLQASPKYAGRSHLNWRLVDMWQQLRSRHWRTAVATLFLALLVVSAVTVAPMRAAASQFLSIFRVRKFAVIQVNPSQIDSLQGFGQSLFSKPEGAKPTVSDVTSAAEASKLTGFAVLTPKTLPKDVQGSLKMNVMGAHTMQSDVNLAAARTLLQSSNLPTDALPQGKDSVRVTAKLSPMFTATYGSDRNAIHVIQGRSPEVDVPDGLDIPRLGELGFRLLGMSADEAARLSKSIDWANTLVVPVPANTAQVREVQIHGVKGYVMEASSSRATDGTVRPAEASVMWQVGDVLYGVSGTGSASRLLEVAESLQ
jgi:hypothetical protein